MQVLTSSISHHTVFSRISFLKSSSEYNNTLILTVTIDKKNIIHVNIHAASVRISSHYVSLGFSPFKCEFYLF